jgi:hypothetical protein
MHSASGWAPGCEPCRMPNSQDAGQQHPQHQPFTHLRLHLRHKHWARYAGSCRTGRRWQIRKAGPPADADVRVTAYHGRCGGMPSQAAGVVRSRCARRVRCSVGVVLAGGVAAPDDHLAAGPDRGRVCPAGQRRRWQGCPLVGGGVVGFAVRWHGDAGELPVTPPQTSSWLPVQTAAKSARGNGMAGSCRQVPVAGL